MVYRERKHFLTSCQLAEETVTEWRVRLQHAAMACQFGEHINAFLVTRFICGLASPDLFEELSKRLEQPVDHLDAALRLVEECERELQQQTGNNSIQDNMAQMCATEMNHKTDVVDTNNTATVSDSAKSKPVAERKISRFQVSPTILENEDAHADRNQSTEPPQDIPPSAPMIRKVSRFSISPAEIPDGIQAPAQSSATTTVNAAPAALSESPVRKSSVERIDTAVSSFTPVPLASLNTSQETTSLFSPSPVPSVIHTESQSNESIHTPTKKNKPKKSVPSSLESLTDIGSPSRKQSSSENTSAWEQLKIGLENITHAVVPSLSKTSQSPASDSVLDSDSPPVLQTRSRPNSPPETLIYSKRLNGPDDSAFPQLDLQTLQTVLNNSLACAKKETVTKTRNKSTSRRRFVRRNNEETVSKVLPQAKSSYFDMDTIEMEYPRNLDSNIEMLGLEAEHMEEQFTVTKDDKLLSYVPLDSKGSCDALKESSLVEETTGKTDAVRDDDDPIGMSPCKRFFKYNKEVGFGSFKTVFRGLDTHTGVAVAWCELLGRKVKKAERLRFREEADMLKKLQNPNIVRFYDYWEITSGIDKRRNIVLVTELMLSGTLKSYLKRFKQINPKVFKSWCRQILKGLYFLHTRNPTIIHRDLKCDNIFITGTTGCVKIGDLGLATLKDGSFAKSIIGTPEFMAPEMYEEHYDEAVDIYAFGMCMLEMTTSEYPYNECTSPAQIYKKVANGIKPESFAKVTDERVRDIISHCTQLKKEDRPDCKYLLNTDFFSDDTGLKLQPFNKDMFLNNPDCNRIEFRLRLLDSKQRQFKHREDEAIQFDFEIGVDNTDELASDMFLADIIREEDSRTVAKLLKVQIASMLKERRELAANNQQTPVQANSNTPSMHNSSEPILVPVHNRSNSFPCGSPGRNCSFNDSPVTMSPVNSPPLHSAPVSRKTSTRVMSPIQQNGEQQQNQLCPTTPSRSKKSSRCDPLVPRLQVISVKGSMVECSMECMMKTITFQFDMEDVNPNDVANRLISQELLDETQRTVFAVMVSDVVKTELLRMRQETKPIAVMNGHPMPDPMGHI